MSGIFPGQQFNLLNGFADQYIRSVMGGQLYQAIGFCDITDAAGQLSWDIKLRSHQRGESDRVGLTLPANAYVYLVGIKAEAGLIATNGNRLRVATTTVNTGAGAIITSAAAANTTFGTADAIAQINPFANEAAAVTGLGALGGSTLRVYVDNGADAVGSQVRAATGQNKLVMVEVLYRVPHIMPQFSEVAGKLIVPT